MKELRYLSKDELHDNFWVVVEALIMLDKMLGDAPQSKGAEEYGCYKYISYNPGRFLINMRFARKALAVLKRPEECRFLDVGCGVGTKLIMASEFFQQVDGLEYDQHYYTTARQIVKLNQLKNCKIYKGDALVYPRFGKYDIIYLYRPFRDSEKQTKLEMKIMRDAKPDAIIVGALCTFLELPAAHRPVELFENVYIKCSPARGKTIRKKAEAICLEPLNINERSSTKKLREMLVHLENGGKQTVVKRQTSNGQAVSIDAVLAALSKVSPRQSDLADFRLNHGFSVEEASAFLGISEATGMRDWSLAKRWIRTFIPNWVPPPLKRGE